MSTEGNEFAQSHTHLDELTNEILDLICFHAINRNHLYHRRKKNPLDGLSRSSKFFNSVCAPHHFRVVSVCSGWELSRAAIMLSGCERFHNHTRRLKIDVAPNKAIFKDELWRYNFVARTTYDLHCLLGPVCWRIDELYLSLRLPFQGLAQDLRSTLRRHKGRVERMPCDNPRLTLNMPKLKKLIVGNYCEFILDQCPNVEEVSSNGAEFIGGFHENDSICFGSSRLVDSLSRLRRLKHLELDAAWDCFQVCRLIDILKPVATQLEKLALHGSLSYETSARSRHIDEQLEDPGFYGGTPDDAMDYILQDGFTSGFWQGDMPSTASESVKLHIQETGEDSWLRTRHIRAMCRRALNAFRLPNLRILTLPEFAQLGCQYRRQVLTDPPLWDYLDRQRVHVARWGRNGVIPVSASQPFEIAEDGTALYPDEKCIATMAMECAEYLTDIIGTNSDSEIEGDDSSDDQITKQRIENKTRKNGWMLAEENFIGIVEGDIIWLAANVVTEECGQIKEIWFGDHVRVSVINVVMVDGNWEPVDKYAFDGAKQIPVAGEAYTLICTRKTLDGRGLVRDGVFMQKARNIYRW